MAWTTPLTAIVNAAITAAQWNASVRDNLNETAPAKATAAGQIFVSTGANAIAARTPTSGFVGTGETSTSGSYTALTTPGPSVTVTTGANCIVALYAQANNTTAGGATLMAYDLSGATTVAANDTNALFLTSEVANSVNGASAVFMQACTPGSNTFTAKYRVGAGTGGWSNRRITVIPL